MVLSPPWWGSHFSGCCLHLTALGEGSFLHETLMIITVNTHSSVFYKYFLI